jgi:hypothetical protein
MSNVFDCLIVGNGRAPLVLAAALAKAGFATTLVRSEKQRCPQAGEIVPDCCTALLAELTGTVEGCQPPETAWPLPVADYQGRLLPFPRDANPSAPAHSGRLLRSSDLDLLLLRAAERQGVHIRIAVDAPTSQRLGPLVELRFSESDGQELSLPARSLVHFRQGLSEMSLDGARISVRRMAARVAIWGYYTRVGPPSAALPAGPLVIQSADPTCRFWVVPLAGDITSVGFVGPSNLVHDEHSAIATVFEEQLTGCPAVLERLIAAELVGPLHRQCDSDRVEFAAGDRTLFLPCQWRQIDPLFGGQAVLDLAVGVWMARALSKCLRSGDLSAARLDREIASFLAVAEELASWIDRVYRESPDRNETAQFGCQFASLGRRLLWPDDASATIAAENDPKRDAPEVATLPRG